MKGDLISRKAAMSILDRWLAVKGYSEGEMNVMRAMWFELDELPDVKAEPLTDAEQRIFLAAMGRERGICEKTDAEMRDTNDPEAINLVRVCDNIEKKVRAALWTT